MKASVLFLLALLALFVIAIAVRSSDTTASSTGVVVAGKEAYLTTESFLLYTILLIFAAIVCLVLWYFNRLFDREEKRESHRKK